MGAGCEPLLREDEDRRIGKGHECLCIHRSGALGSRTGLTVKKKWKPALRETLSDEEKLTFEPKEWNRRVIADIREVNTKVRNKRERERYPKNLEIAP